MDVEDVEDIGRGGVELAGGGGVAPSLLRASDALAFAVSDLRGVEELLYALEEQPNDIRGASVAVLARAVGRALEGLEEAKSLIGVPGRAMRG